MLLRYTVAGGKNTRDVKNISHTQLPVTTVKRLNILNTENRANQWGSNGTQCFMGHLGWD
ncbi:MAG TPA: hypothetical protein VGJ05_22740 [Fimbriiglobus sp.]|jgi:hypothetical protein